jgi:hypothetical protein
MSWAPGTVVVCVTDQSTPPIPGRAVARVIRDVLVVGHHYTVRHCEECDFSSGRKVGVWLNEIVRVTEINRDAPYGSHRFRLAEGGQCEAERARSMKPVEVRK